MSVQNCNDMKKLQQVLLIFILTISFHAFGQSSFNYALTLVPVTVTDLPGLQSYTFAQHNGKWLIIGGRKDGLHARQPFNSFPASHNNTDIYVVDVPNNQFWSASVNSLPTGLKEQLQSTNMVFYQDDDTLFIIGGYGFSASLNKYITYPYLTSVNVHSLISAIIDNQPITPYFKQIEDTIFKVTGSHLKKINETFYMVGGHLFDGRYNPMGNPTYTQVYTNQIRKFNIDNSGSQLSYYNYSTITDPVHLRRRDYNLLPQIFPNGEQGLTISSGVFQIGIDLPFLYPVDITENGYTPITTFNQYLSHYHSAVACMYDASSNHMHSLFFGGMSQYYYQDGVLVQDSMVPFVKTISRLTRDGQGNLTEYQMPIEMPALQGSSAEFIPNMELPHYSNKVFKLNEITLDSFRIGYIYGGIYSPSLNPFMFNQTSTTSADNTIYEVWLTADPVSITEYEIDGSNPHQIELFPNPFENDVMVRFNLNNATNVSYFVTNNLGQIVLQSDNRTYPDGAHELQLNLSQSASNELLYLTVVFDNKYFTTKKLLRK